MDRSVVRRGLRTSVLAAVVAVLVSPAAATAAPAAVSGTGPKQPRSCAQKFDQAQRTDMESFRDFDLRTWLAGHDQGVVSIVADGRVRVGLEAVAAASKPRFTSKDSVWSWTEITRKVLASDLRALRELIPGSRVARMGCREFAERTAEAMAVYWSAVLEPLWDRIEAITGGDIAHRSVALASDGLERALDELHAGVTWVGDALTLPLGQSLVRLPSTGLCSSRRDGKRVLYSRTSRAELLLDIDAAQAR